MSWNTNRDSMTLNLASKTKISCLECLPNQEARFILSKPTQILWNSMSKVPVIVSNNIFPKLFRIIKTSEFMANWQMHPTIIIHCPLKYRTTPTRFNNPSLIHWLSLIFYYLMKSKTQFLSQASIPQYNKNNSMVLILMICFVILEFGHILTIDGLTLKSPSLKRWKKSQWLRKPKRISSLRVFTKGNERNYSYKNVRTLSLTINWSLLKNSQIVVWVLKSWRSSWLCLEIWRCTQRMWASTSLTGMATLLSAPFATVMTYQTKAIISFPAFMYCVLIVWGKWTNICVRCVKILEST